MQAAMKQQCSSRRGHAEAVADVAAARRGVESCDAAAAACCCRLACSPRRCASPRVAALLCSFLHSLVVPSACARLNSLRCTQWSGAGGGGQRERHALRRRCPMRGAVSAAATAQHFALLVCVRDDSSVEGGVCVSAALASPRLACCLPALCCRPPASHPHSYTAAARRHAKTATHERGKRIDDCSRDDAARHSLHSHTLNSRRRRSHASPCIDCPTL